MTSVEPVAHGEADLRRPRHRTPWWRRGGSLAVAAVLTTGALAAAVGSVLTLWPDPDVGDEARFTSVPTVVFPISLGEYSARYTGMVPDSDAFPRPAVDAVPGVELAAHMSTDESATEPTDEPTGPTDDPTDDPTDEPTDDPTDDPTTDPTTDERAPTDSTVGRLLRPGVEALRGVEDVVDDAEVLRPDLDLEREIAIPDPPDRGLLAVGALTDVAFAMTQGPDGEPVAADVAAARLVELLGETRTMPTPEGQQVPLGVVVSTNVELVGLRGRPVLVTWEIWQQGGGTQLYDAWLDSVTAYELTASTEHDTAAFDFWVPLPQAPGSYVVTVALSMPDGSRLASTNSTPFG